MAGLRGTQDWDRRALPPVAESVAAGKAGAVGPRVASRPAGRLPLGLIVVIVGAIAAGVILACRRGLDMSDESYYLLAMSHVDPYPETASQFGFVFRPLYLLVGGDIFWLRVTGLAVVLALAGAVSWQAVVLGSGPTTGRRSARLVISAGVAVSALLIVGPWLPTPNYNSLTFIGMLVTAWGLLRSASVPQAAPWFPWAVIGLGVLLTGLAKPPSALFLVPVVLGCAAVMGILGWRAVVAAGAVASAGLLLVAFALDGSVFGFVGRISGAAEALNTLIPDYGFTTSLRLFVSGLVSPDPAPARSTLLAAAALAGACAAATLLRVSRSPRLAAAGTIALVCLPLAAATVLLGWTPLQVGAGQQHAHLLVPPFYLMLAVALGSVAAAVACRACSGPDRRRLGAVAFLAVLPFLSALGSESSVWLIAPNDSFFWVVAGALFLTARFPAADAERALSATAVMSAVVTACYLVGIWGAPYRIGPIWEAQEEMRLGPEGSTLILDPKQATLVAGIRATAESGGFPPGTPLVNLTGWAPGVAVVMDAVPVGFSPWVVGDRPGTLAVTERGWGTTPCEILGRAWIVRYAPDYLAGGLVPDAAIAAFGADPAQDFEVVGGPSPFGGQPYDLLRPTRPPQKAAADCRAARGSSAAEDVG